MKNICILLSNGTRILLNNISSSCTIGNIKQTIQQQISKDKMIKLIHHGQILNNDVQKIIELSNTDTIYFHCSISDLTPFTCIKPVKKEGGFDKLRDSGYNEEEIRNIRLQFHQTSNTNYVDGEPPSEEAIRLEEEWLEQAGIRMPEAVNDSFKEMFYGLLLGFFLGVLCLFWVRESVFTRRHQLGILAGMLINVSCINYVYY